MDCANDGTKFLPLNDGYEKYFLSFTCYKKFEFSCGW